MSDVPLCIKNIRPSQSALEAANFHTSSNGVNLAQGSDRTCRLVAPIKQIFSRKATVFTSISLLIKYHTKTTEYHKNFFQKLTIKRP